MNYFPVCISACWIVLCFFAGEDEYGQIEHLHQISYQKSVSHSHLTKNIYLQRTPLYKFLIRTYGSHKGVYLGCHLEPPLLPK